ncbi:MAG: glycosyltransferase family 4 protein [Candidatus Tantalella remota]|nr:glycosyltransferase family 4 protein [Candidatus Tantalella remota]
MNIAIVSLQFEETATGGGGVHVKHICEQFLKMGHNVTIISIHTDRTLIGSEIREAEVPYSVQTRGDLKIIRLLIDRDIDQPYVGGKEAELDRIMRFAAAAIVWIHKNPAEYDVINLQGHHILPGYMAKELQGIGPKVISYLHALETTYVTADGKFVGAYDGTAEILSKIREWESMCRFADIVIGNSPIVNEEFKGIIAEYEDEPEKYYDRIKLVASGCDEDFLLDDETVRAKLVEVPETINLVTFCRVDPSKGVEYSIRGAKEAALLSDRHYRLTIAGIPASDEYVEKLKQERTDLPKNLEVEFRFTDAISPLEEKKEILDDKHIYILPTLKEPFGMSLIEASARGLMAVSADTNGPKYMFDSDKGEVTPWGVITERGVLARITDDPPKKFSQNVGKAIDWTVVNWDRSVSHVLAFNKKIRSTWTWEGIAAQYMELFKS